MKPITAAFATLAIPERRGLRSSSASPDLGNHCCMRGDAKWTYEAVSTTSTNAPI